MNRQSGVWMIIVPAAIIQLLILGTEIVFPAFSSGGLIVFADELNFLAGGLAFIWLLAGFIKNASKPVVSLILVCAMIVAGLIQMLFWMGPGSFAVLGYTMFYLLTSLAIMFALLVGALLCRKRYSPGRFLRVTCISLVCLSLLPLPLIGFVALIEMVGSGDIGIVLTVLGGGALVLLGVGLSLCVLVGVYFAIALRNPELRSRFECIVHPRPDSKPPLPSTFTGVEPVK